MISTEQASIDRIVMHKVGNKNYEDGIILSKQPLQTSELINSLLLQYFFSPFRQEEYYNLYHDSDLKMNEVYNYVSAVFTDPDALYEQSVNLAKHLYEQSVHPKIKAGEFCVAYLKDCIVDGEITDAVGLFKSEMKETYLKIHSKEDKFEIDSETGINVNKLDKGCLVFNIEKEKGYLLAVVDNMKKSSEARYWTNDFLHITPRKDTTYYTGNVISLCRDFVTEVLPDEFQVDKADQAELLNQSAAYMKQQNTFEMDAFAKEVMKQPELVELFKDYSEEYQNRNNIEIASEFDIAGQAVKKNARYLRSVIKLDKNFHVYIHGNRQRVLKGYDDEKGLNFYTLYYEEES
jgi:hypothetical protein